MPAAARVGDTTNHGGTIVGPGLATVLIGNKPAAVMGCSGMNTPPHVGLHLSDPYFAPPTQIGRIVSGSPTVLIGGQPAATQSSSATCCVTPGTLVPTVTTVLIG